MAGMARTVCGMSMLALASAQTPIPQEDATALYVMTSILGFIFLMFLLACCSGMFKDCCSGKYGLITFKQYSLSKPLPIIDEPLVAVRSHA